MTADLYEGLARYQWGLRRLRRQAPGEGLEMHKRLAPPPAGQPGPPPGAAWHAWLWQQLQAGPQPVVLDVGCGFGASVLHWARQHAGQFVGLGNSAYQLACARAEAVRLGLGDRCAFRLQAHGEPIAGAFSAVLGVETLVHADDLPRALRAIANCLRPGARFVSMEDVARATAAPDRDVHCLQTRWGLRRLWNDDDWTVGAAAAGLRCAASFDLTAQVAPRPAPTLARAERMLTALRWGALGRRARGAVDAFLGGIALERLYAAGAMNYRCAVFVREDR